MGFYTKLLNITNITQYYQCCIMLLIQLAHCRFPCIHDLGVAAVMSTEACSKHVHIFTIAAQNTLSQDEIDVILYDDELNSYLFTFGEVKKKPLQSFYYPKTHVQFLR